MKTTQRWLALILSVIMLITLLPTAAAAVPAVTTARAAVQDGGDVLTVGNTRADLAYAIWWMAGCPAPTTAESPYTDLPADHVCFQAILWVVEQGIMLGTGAYSFGTDQVCTRAQTVQYLWTAAGKPEPAAGAVPYTDVAESAWYYQALLWAVQQPYIDLSDDGASFRPNDSLSGLAVCADASAAGGFLVALSTVMSGACGAEGDELTWSLDMVTGTLTISGTGAMADYATDDASQYNRPTAAGWGAYADILKKVVIGNGVTSIGNIAFSQCYALEQVELPDSVTRIGRRAFNYCTSLAEIDLPDSVAEIGQRAFHGCTSLQSITIPRNVISLDYTFNGCSNLKSVTILNPFCVFVGSDHELGGWEAGTALGDDPKAVTICSYSGSWVETFANRYGYQFSAIGAMDPYSGPCDLRYHVTWSLDPDTGTLAISGSGAMEAVEFSWRFFDPDTLYSYNTWQDYRDMVKSVVIEAGVTSIPSGAFGNCSNLQHVLYGAGEEQWNDVINNSELTDAPYFHWNAQSLEEHAAITAQAPATCVAAGSVSYTCPCGYQWTDETPVDPDAHVWGDWEVTTPATEDEPGEETRTCTLCGATETRSFDLRDSQFYLDYNPLEDVLIYVATGDAMPDPETQDATWDGIPMEFTLNEPIRLLVDTAHRIDADRYSETGDEKQSLIDMDPEADIFVELWSYHDGDESWTHELVVEHSVAISDKVTFEDNLLTFVPTEYGQYDFDFTFSAEQHELYQFSASEEYPLNMDIRVWGNGTINDPEEVLPENILRCRHRSGTQLIRCRLSADTETLTFTWPEDNYMGWLNIEGGGNYVEMEIPEEHRFVLPLDWTYQYEGWEDVPIDWYIFYIGFNDGPGEIDWVGKDDQLCAWYDRWPGSVFWSVGEEMPTADMDHYLNEGWDYSVCFTPNGVFEPIHLLLDNSQGINWDIWNDSGEVVLEERNPEWDSDGYYADACYVDENGDWFDGTVLYNGEVVREGWTFENNILSYTPANDYNIEVNVWWRERDYAFDHFYGTEECPVVIHVVWYGWYDEDAVPVPEGIDEENYVADWGRMRIRVPWDTESVTFTWNGDLVNISYSDMFEEFTWLDVVPEGDSYTLYLDNTWEDGSPWDYYNIDFNFVDEWNSMFRLDYDWGDYVIYGAIDETPEATAVAAWMGFEDYSYWNDGKPGEINLLIDLNHRIDGDVWDEEGRIELVDPWEPHDEGYSPYIVGHLWLPNGEYYEGLIVEDGVAVVDGVSFENNLLKFTPQRGDCPWIQVFASKGEYEIETFEGTDEYPVVIGFSIFDHGNFALPEGVLPENALVREYFHRIAVRFRVSTDLESITFTWPEGCTLNEYDLFDCWEYGNYPGPEEHSLTLPLNGSEWYYATFWFEEGAHEWSDWTTVVAPTCTEPGEELRTCTICMRTEQREVEALGHDWNEPEYVWADDCGTVTATRVCKNDGSHIETETVHTTFEVTKEATYEAEGEITYTARFENAAFATQTKAVATPKLVRPVEFTDVPGNAYYADAVAWAVAQEVTNGTSATTFGPDKTCTRGQVVTFLWRAKGCPEPTSTENPFTDVSENDYYYKAVLWAKETGVTSGTSATKFSPGKGCTRGQVVTFLWRAEGEPEPSSTANPFTDVPAGQYYTKAVLWAVENGITNGTGATSFSPDKTCTRGQIVTFLYRDLG